MNNNLIHYKESLILKVKKFFENIISKEKDKKIMNDIKPKKNFLENIIIKENEREKRLKQLKHLYDNKKITEEEILDEDIDALIEMYDKEIEELNADTEKRKKHIMQMMKAQKNCQ